MELQSLKPLSWQPWNETQQSTVGNVQQHPVRMPLVLFAAFIWTRLGLMGADERS